MDKKKIIGIVLIAVLSISAVVSGIMFTRQYSDSKASKEAFSSLADLVVDIDTSRQAEPVEDTETDEVSETDESAAVRRGWFYHRSRGPGGNRCESAAGAYIKKCHCKRSLPGRLA